MENTTLRDPDKVDFLACEVFVAVLASSILLLDHHDILN
jgi:hypothetical protein